MVGSNSVCGDDSPFRCSLVSLWISGIDPGALRTKSKNITQLSKAFTQLGRCIFSGRYPSQLIFLGILACYALLIIPTVDRLGIGWDEATDLVIAQAYQTPQGMLRGLSWDVSQTRMPMFIVALVFRLFGVSNLLLARYTTVLVGGLTLWGIFVYGKEQFTPTTGLLAAGILAINPFFLTFARMAFTESDVYVACALVWLLVALRRLEREPTLGWGLLSAILLSFAISSKAVALVLVPVVCVSFILNQIYPPIFKDQSRGNDLHNISARSTWLLGFWTLLFALVGVLVSGRLNAESHSGILHLLNYGFICLGWFIALVWAIRNREAVTQPIALATFLAGFCLLTFLIIPPEHLTNSGIIKGVISRVDEEMTFSMGFMLELAALHTFILFLKSTPVLGFGLLAGFVVSLTQWRRPELTTSLMIVAAYLAILLILPLGQTFYTIPLLPILSLLAADQLLRLWSKHRHISLALVTLGLIWWAVEMSGSYPDYHLNGYQWLGARPFLGRSSLGYRSIVYTPLDGVQQAMGWLNTHAKAGQIALLYAGPPYIIDTLAPDPAYAIIYGPKSNLDSKPDYVVVHMDSIIRQGEGSDTPQENIFEYPFDYGILQREYEKVFSVWRAFNLEMASVWKRK
jgi:hypothetical protein